MFRMPWLGFERSWRGAIVRALLPPSEDGRFTGAPGELDAFFARFEEASPPQLRLGLRAAVWAVALAPAAVLGRARPFDRLERADQEAVLAACARSPLFPVRQAFVVLRLASCFAAFSGDEARARFGAPPARPDAAGEARR